MKGLKVKVLVQRPTDGAKEMELLLPARPMVGDYIYLYRPESSVGPWRASTLTSSTRQDRYTVESVAWTPGTEYDCKVDVR